MGVTHALTLDTSSLLALERKRQRIGDVVAAAKRAGRSITIPAACVAEWWRGRTDRREYVLGVGVVRPLDASLARTAGEAMAWLRRRGGREDDRVTVDAIVMATAALHGINLYTGDFDDLARFREFFPAVRLFAVSG